MFVNYMILHIQVWMIDHSPDNMLVSFLNHNNLTTYNSFLKRAELFQL